MEDVYNQLKAVVDSIIQSKEYQTCIQLKEPMSTNQEITLLISKIKKLQKKYVREFGNPSIKNELDLLENQLDSIPIYHVYMDSLSIVNDRIDYVKDCLNQYFYQLMNEKDK